MAEPEAKPVDPPPETLPRCVWAGTDSLYRRYHDTEWGRPMGDDARLFEKLCLEGFQAGLSWLTILRKRERFREVFFGFDIDRVALMDDTDIVRLLGDAGIVRHRGKIASTINNARHALLVRREFGTLARYFWGFEPAPDERPAVIGPETIPASTPASARLSKDLKARGFTFVGPTTCYAFMQAMGLVNDHAETCFCRAAVEKERAAFSRP